MQACRWGRLSTRRRVEPCYAEKPGWSEEFGDRLGAWLGAPLTKGVDSMLPVANRFVLGWMVYGLIERRLRSTRSPLGHPRAAATTFSLPL